MKNLSLLMVTAMLSVSGNVNAKAVVGDVGGEGGGNMSTKANITLTGYAGACKHDSQGGGSESALLQGRWSPKDHTLTGKAKVVAVAVPQSGGTADLYGCLFKIELEPKPGGMSDQEYEALKSKTFFAGDRYGKGSNGKDKMDVSLECNAKVNNFTHKNAKAKVIKCLNKNNKKQILAELDSYERNGDGRSFASAGGAATGR